MEQWLWQLPAADPIAFSTAITCLIRNKHTGTHLLPPQSHPTFAAVPWLLSLLSLGSPHLPWDPLALQELQFATAVTWE